jgi:hypothetical protein
MRIVQLTTDAREHYGDYENPKPYFGAAPEALLQGFAALPEAEVHVVACTRREMNAPQKLADNIWFHSLLVPKLADADVLPRCIWRGQAEPFNRHRPWAGTERDCAISAVPGLSHYTLHGNMAELARLFNHPAGSYMRLAARLENFASADPAGSVILHTRSLVKPRAPDHALQPIA